jgi:hypothetical protein
MIPPFAKKFPHGKPNRIIHNMKYTLIAALITFGSLAGGANAGVTFTFEEVGGNVVMTSSGSIDTLGLVSAPLMGWGSVGIYNSGAMTVMGATTGETSELDLAFAFNSGTDFSAWMPGPALNSSFYIFTVTAGSKQFATYSGGAPHLPGLGIVSNDLVGSVWTPDQTWTANGTTFASIGLNPGTYTVSDAVSGESITYQIGPVPEPTSALLVGLGGMLLMSRSRRRE